MGTNLDPGIRDPKKRYYADRVGKGLHRRPSGVGEEEFARNWDRVFGRKKEGRK